MNYREMPQPELKIKNLLVRPWRTDDAEAVFRACQDPAIQRWIPVPRPYEMSHAIGFIANVAIPSWDQRVGAYFGVFDDADGRLLGSMSLTRMDLDAHVAEIGYWIAPDGRGRGAATISGRAVATFGFDVLDLERIIWRADLGNHASRLVAQRIGVRMEGIARGGLTAVDGSGRRVDGWIGAMRPGDVLTETPAGLATGSAAARQAATFGNAKPTLLFPGGSLRPFIDDDIDPATTACQDPDAVRWTTIPPGYTREQAEYFVHEHSRVTWLRGEAAIFAIGGDDDGYVGGIDLRISDGDHEVGEIGIQVAPWARGRGFATAATRTLAAWGFESLGLRRIVYRAHVGNDASRAVAERAGFVYEGVQRAGCVQRGERPDAWILSMLASDIAGLESTR